MGQFGKILKFEFKNYLANKIFVGVTILLVAVIAVVMFFPNMIAAFDDGGDSDAPEDVPVMLLVSEDKEYAESIEQAFADAFDGYEVKLSDVDLDYVKEEIISGKAECAFVLNGLTSYTYYVNNLSMYDTNTAVADEVLQSIYRMSAMVGNGIPAADAGTILATQIGHETETLGKDQMQNYFYTYIMIFALYMVILMYGQMVATNVAAEKGSRAMELLITSAKPVSMMFGKVIASCLAGFIQLVAVFGSAFICFNLNKSYWSDNEIVLSIFDMPFELLLFMLLFFVLGFLIYAFLFGAIGSTVSKMEDINTAVMPITLLFLAAFFVVIFSMSSGSVDTVLMKVCSYIPFTSPMAMFTRIAMSTVPWYGILISTVILIGSVIGIGVLSAKIYRVGVLLYGTSPKLGAILKAIKNA